MELEGPPKDRGQAGPAEGRRECQASTWPQPRDGPSCLGPGGLPVFLLLLGRGPSLGSRDSQDHPEGPSAGSSRPWLDVDAAQSREGCGERAGDRRPASALCLPLRPSPHASSRPLCPPRLLSLPLGLSGPLARSPHSSSPPSSSRRPLPVPTPSIFPLPLQPPLRGDRERLEKDGWK